MRYRLLGLSVVVLVSVISGCAQPTTPDVLERVGGQGISQQSGTEAVQIKKEFDALIVPGERVGLITADSSRADLVKLYGAENVVDRPFYIAEGFCEPGTHVFPDDPERALEIQWGDPSTQSHPRMVQIFDEKAVWKTPDGIGMGTTVKELVRLNGEAFEFSGLGWDYGGYVSSWGKGHLGEKASGLGLRLSAHGEFPQELNVLGEGTFSSDALGTVSEQVQVGQIFLRFEENFAKYPDQGEHQKACEEFDAG